MITMIERAVTILDYLFDRQSAEGISKIALDTGLPKATVFRILSTLEDAHLVEKVYNSNEYKLGIGFLKYSAKVMSNLSLTEVAKPIIEELSKALAEAVNLSIPYQDLSMNIFNSDHGKSNLVAKLIPVSPLHCSATGKWFLSARDQVDQQRYFQQSSLQTRTENTIVDYDSFVRHCEQMLEQGYSTDDEEYEYGLYCVAVPLYHQSRLIAAISVSGPKTRIANKDTNQVIALLRDASQSISERIAYIDEARLIK